MQGIRTRKGRSREHAAAIGENGVDGSMTERDASTCAVRCNPLEPLVPQRAPSIGFNRLSSASMRGSSSFERSMVAADLGVSEDCAPRHSDHSGTGEFSRSGSWPGVIPDDLEHMFDCTLNLTNIRRTLEPKDHRPYSDQRSSRFVEAVSRTFSKRSERASPKSAVAALMGLQPPKDKKGSQWEHLIRALRVKRWSQVLASASRQESPESVSDTAEDEAGDKLGKRTCAIVDGVNDPASAKGLDKRFGPQVNRNLRPITATTQYARFRPRSIGKDAKRRLRSSARRIYEESTPPAIVRAGHRDGLDAVNYGLVRIREAGGSVQVYDCVEKETGRMLSVKLIPRDHAAAELYEHLCENGHANFVKIVQVLEDKKLFYILMDFNNTVYLREFYHDSHPRTFTESLIRSIVKHLLNALAYIHRRGMVVAGLSMDSVIIHKTTNGEVVAKISNLDDVCTTTCRHVYNTQENALEAPEVGDGLLTCSSDMWSLGVLLYTLAEGRPPYKQFTSKSYAKRAAAVRGARLTFAAEAWIDAPRMKDFCLRCLQPDHRQRVASAMEAFIHPWIRE
ncbi:kinase domain containing protein [Babesia ovata]|uniref:non-specific serine/threonine protein kinase n=1 Tax=Babesia ovata TaxID=189622 RepID=A0A2H6KAT0_9APIC|nr:kinase domain containing protein [Babesia ovata]GBE60102.1 kinase domain containing protein [Babesia ovata]